MRLLISSSVSALLALIFGWSSPAYALEEVTLLCEIKLQTKHGTSPPETKVVSTRIEVTDYGRGRITVLPDSTSLFSIGGMAEPSGKVENRSTPDKWHIKERSELGRITDREVIIDRRAGTISLNRMILFPSGSLFEEDGFGRCEKVDKSKRKF